MWNTTTRLVALMLCCVAVYAGEPGKIPAGPSVALFPSACASSYEKALLPAPVVSNIEIIVNGTYGAKGQCTCDTDRTASVLFRFYGTPSGPTILTPWSAAGTSHDVQTTSNLASSTNYDVYIRVDGIPDLDVENMSYVYLTNITTPAKGVYQDYHPTMP